MGFIEFRKMVLSLQLARLRWQNPIDIDRRTMANW
jgi:hypothetical protein